MSYRSAHPTREFDQPMFEDEDEEDLPGALQGELDVTESLRHRI